MEFERRRWQSQEIHNGRPLGDFEFCGFFKDEPIVHLDQARECKFHKSQRLAFRDAVTTERRLFAAGPNAYAPLLKLLDESEDA